MAAELHFGATKLGSAKFAVTIAAWLAGFEVRPWPVEATYHYAEARTALEPENWPGVRGRGKLRNVSVQRPPLTVALLQIQDKSIFPAR